MRLRELHDLLGLIITEPQAVQGSQGAFRPHFLDELVHFIAKGLACRVHREGHHNVQRFKARMNVSQIRDAQRHITNNGFIVDKAVQLACGNQIRHVGRRIVVLDLCAWKQAAGFLVYKDKSRLHAKPQFRIFVHVGKRIVLETLAPKLGRNVFQQRIPIFDHGIFSIAI